MAGGGGEEKKKERIESARERGKSSLYRRRDFPNKNRTREGANGTHKHTRR
jgi:hypothetical protein